MLRVPDLELPADHPERRRLAAIAAHLDVPADGLVLASSLADFTRHALAAAPQVDDRDRQQALTGHFLTPARDGLEALFRQLRAEADHELARAEPIPGAKPYPLGRCGEIRDAVARRLARFDPSPSCGPAAQALRAFLDAGGAVRRAWGELRGAYFQNALIVGTLYVDVANDSVVVTKPPVQIVPLEQAQFHAIADHGHYVRIAERYWNCRFLPNHLLPDLAPWLPLIQVSIGGGLGLGPAEPYMLALALTSRFGSSAQALAAAPLPAETFESFRRALAGGPTPVADTAEAGRAAALALCREHRLADSAAAFNRAVVAGREVNRRLARMIALPRAA